MSGKTTIRATVGEIKNDGHRSPLELVSNMVVRHSASVARTSGGRRPSSGEGNTK
jgi:hypothetical protein